MYTMILIHPFVAFPNKTGILYSSNRPTATAGTARWFVAGVSILIFSWLTTGINLNSNKYPNSPTLNGVMPGFLQYKKSHFTFISDENGVNNRYAGFFTTERAGWEYAGIHRRWGAATRPKKDVDSLLKNGKNWHWFCWVCSITNDSSYVFRWPTTRAACWKQELPEITRW